MESKNRQFTIIIFVAYLQYGAIADFELQRLLFLT